MLGDQPQGNTAVRKHQLLDGSWTLMYSSDRGLLAMITWLQTMGGDVSQHLSSVTDTETGCLTSRVHG